MDAKTFLSERKSVRQYDPNHEISQAEIENILELAAKAPSSNNVQPWKVFVVRSPEKKKQIRELAFGQRHVEEASALFIIFGDKSVYDIDQIIQYDVDHGILKEERVADYRGMLEKFFEMYPKDRDDEGVKLDTALFAMNLMHVVRAFGYDSVPVRGADFKAIQKYLNISEDLVPVLLLPVGVAKTAGYPHVRKDVAEFATIID